MVTRQTKISSVPSACVQAQELQQVLAGISGAEQELQALQEQREQLQPAAKEAAELRCAIAQLQDEVRGCLWSC